MQQVKDDDHITVEYVGILDTGEIFENTDDSGPLSFQVGKGAVLPAFETAVLGLKAGDTTTVTIAPGDAYGEKLEELVHTLNRKALGTKTDPSPGMVVGMTIDHNGTSQQVPAMVTAVDDDQVTVDFNHPLAGKTLSYTITVTAIGQQPDDN